ncbi:hypothetical protein AAFC00_002353 [Neodothiora populina]|uniref:Extracelular serine carboxypeptidase n=1 Tax=Neodothiora populina TaxID=2781224 RepID=A0ABR3PH55_9PEZI
MLFCALLAGLVATTYATPLDIPSLLERSKNGVQRRQSAVAYDAHIIDMPIDHFPNSPQYKPHANGTFKQRYYFDSTYYKPGGPVYLYIGGETSGPSRFSNLQTGIIQILMEATNGLGVILENRYYGESYPFNISTTDNMVYLSNEQTIADNAYFAQHAVFPGANASLNAPDTPWILYGGSLAGAQTAFSIKQYPDLLYGGIASSGTTHAVVTYPEWYKPIQKYAPQDCVSSINAIVDKIDHVFASKDRAAINKMKALFGLESLVDDRDFAQTIAFPLGGPMFYPTSTWQELNWSPLFGSNDFFDFCGNVTKIDAPANVTTVDKVLANYTQGQAWTNLGNYAKYIKDTLLPGCPDGDYANTACFGTQNASYWADTSNTDDRSYMWTSCTEQGTWIEAPKSGPSLISRVLQANYTQQWCTWSFPPGNYSSIPAYPDTSKWNKFGGLSVEADRLAHIDGNIDPWLDICYHSTYAPPRYSSDLKPEYLITGAGHHWDSYGILDVPAEPQFIRETHLFEIRTVKKWLREFPGWKAKSKRDEL